MRDHYGGTVGFDATQSGLYVRLRTGSCIDGLSCAAPPNRGLNSNASSNKTQLKFLVIGTIPYNEARARFVQFLVNTGPNPG